MTPGMPVESPVHGDMHAGFGGRVEETERPKGWHRAPARPYTFRFNRRRSRSRGLVFYRVLELAAAHDPIRYRELIANPRPGRAGRRACRPRHVGGQPASSDTEQGGRGGAPAHSTPSKWIPHMDPFSRALQRGFVGMPGGSGLAAHGHEHAPTRGGPEGPRSPRRPCAAVVGESLRRCQTSGVMRCAATAGCRPGQGTTRAGPEGTARAVCRHELHTGAAGTSTSHALPLVTPRSDVVQASI